MRAKLADVAAKAGVSITTVSRVINNYGSISEKTRTKVYAAMEELNYQPNSLARSLKGKKSRLIGVIIPDLAHPFFSELVSDIEAILFEKQFKVIICNAGTDRKKEREYLQMLLANQVDGIIAGAHNLGIDEYQRAGLPIVSFDRALSDQIPIISSDNYHGGVIATQQLYNAGARHIWFLGDPSDQGNPTDERMHGYEDTMNTLGLTTNVQTMKFGESATLKQVIIRKMLVENEIDGVVCSDDLTALLVLQIAHQLGKKVPAELKVIGYDGTELIQTYHPELTTIGQPIHDLAHLLVEVLQNRIANPDQPLPNQQYTLPVKFIHGTSI